MESLSDQQIEIALFLQEKEAKIEEAILLLSSRVPPIEQSICAQTLRELVQACMDLGKAKFIHEMMLEDGTQKP